jgi:hypothetical protein
MRGPANETRFAVAQKKRLNPGYDPVLDAVDRPILDPVLEAVGQPSLREPTAAQPARC